MDPRCPSGGMASFAIVLQMAETSRSLVGRPFLDYREYYSNIIDNPFFLQNKYSIRAVYILHVLLTKEVAILTYVSESPGYGHLSPFYNTLRF